MWPFSRSRDAPSRDFHMFPADRIADPTRWDTTSWTKCRTMHISRPSKIQFEPLRWNRELVLPVP